MHSQLRTRAVEHSIATHVRQKSKEQKSPTLGFLPIIAYVMAAISPCTSNHLRTASLLAGLPPMNRVQGHDLSTSLHLKTMARTSNDRGGYCKAARNKGETPRWRFLYHLAGVCSNTAIVIVGIGIFDILSKQQG